MSSKEIVHLMEHLGKEDQMKLLTMLEPEDAAVVMEEIPEAQAVEIIEELPEKDAAAILDEMESDEQADIIKELIGTYPDHHYRYGRVFSGADFCIRSIESDSRYMNRFKKFPMILPVTSPHSFSGCRNSLMFVLMAF